MKKEYIEYLTKNFGRVDLSLEEMSRELGLTPKTVAAYGQRLGLARNTIFELLEDEVFISLSKLGYSEYEISNYGKIRTKEKGVLITSSPHHQSGYLQTRLLHDNGERKSVLVHILVANSFLQKEEDKQIDHIDGNRTNNHISNLQFLSASENVRKAKERNNPVRYLTKEEVIDICEKLEKGLSINDICQSNEFYTKSKVEKIKQKTRWVEISKNYKF